MQEPLEVEEVTELPELDQTLFLPLPTPPKENNFIFPQASPFRNYEKEIVLGGMATIAVKNGSWCPVNVVLLVRTISKVIHGDQSLAGLLEAIAWLFENGEIKIIRYKEEKYLIPTPDFVAKLSQSKVGQM